MKLRRFTLVAALFLAALAALAADNRPIGIFDSGTGGLTVLEQMLSKDFANEHFVYLGDQANMPYGDYAAAGKSEFLKGLVVKDAKFLLAKNAKILVIACNTATAYGHSAVAELLAKRGDGTRVIGVVNAGARSAIKQLDLERKPEPCAIGVLATPGTIASGVYERTLKDELKKLGVKCEVQVFSRGCAGLADAVEAGSPDAPKIAVDNLCALMAEHRAQAPHLPLKAVILGCTHFPFVRRELAAAAPAGVKFIDPAADTALECLAALKAQDRRADCVRDIAADVYVSVPRPGLAASKLDGKGGLARAWKYGRKNAATDNSTVNVSLSEATKGDRLKFIPFAHMIPKVKALLSAKNAFAFHELTPSANAAGTAAMTHEFGPFPIPGADAGSWVIMGSGGLTNLAEGVGSYAFLAVADPKTRRGYVAGWLTDEWASGSVHYREGGIVFRAEYGRLKTGADVSAQKDVFVIGEFDDCRLGLEKYADEIARRYSIKLPPQMAGFCTWYSDQGGFTTDRTKKFRGACSSGMTREFIDKVKALGLKKWGFDYYQIDDTWQDGVKSPGPAKVFTRIDPQGPYPEGMKPTADYIAANGFVAGIWYMPFSGEPSDPWWRERMDLFVKCAVDRPAAGIRKRQFKGAPYETVFGAGALDMSNPKTLDYVKELVALITRDWGYRLIKFDGMYSGMAVELGRGGGYVPDDLGNQIFADPRVSNVQAYRRGVQAMREGSAPGTQLLACNVKQNARGIAASYGLVEMMRIGGDNGPIDYKAERYMAGPIDGSPRYFYNGRVWYNDPDPVYVRDAVSLSRARLFASWTAIGALLYNFSDWLPALSPERVEVLKRTLAPHRKPLKTRPVDYFERTVHNIWKLTDGDYAVFGLYNWDTNATLKIDRPLAATDLDAAKTYVGFDFWNNQFVPAFSGRFRFDVPPDSCRVIAVRELKSHPFVISTSRHVASPVFEVSDERWDAATRTLSGVSRVVPGESYELRVVVGGQLKRHAFTPESEEFKWRIKVDE